LTVEVIVEKLPMDALAERVDGLERENRLWRWGGGFALTSGLMLIFGGAQRADDPKSVEAEQFIVRDKDGKERARLGLASNGGPALFLHSTDGHNRVVLQASDRDDSGSLYLFGGDKGADGITVILNGGRRNSNSPSLFLRRDDKTRIHLNVSTLPDLVPWLRFEDEGRTFFQVPEPQVKPLSRP
jgi:hypothetical protein